MPDMDYILYSTISCPYALRARMSLIQCPLPVRLREVDLGNKPHELMDLSAKATVPVLRLPDSQVIDESRDIVEWVYASLKIDPQGPFHQDYELFIDGLESHWIPSLLRYKYPTQYPDHKAPIHAQRIDDFFIN